MNDISNKEEQVMRKAIAEEEKKRHHVVMTLSGAHAYGFPSPDSDLDIKSIHLQPTRELLGFSDHSKGYDRLEVIEGVEIDYSSNELGPVLQGMLGGNGNYIERVWGALILHRAPELTELQELMPQIISKRIYNHYRGFAKSQRITFEKAQEASAKKLLYVVRTALTGIHMLHTGELRVDLRTTAEEYAMSEVQELIEIKRQGEKTILPESQRQAWIPRLDKIFRQLDEALDKSILPDVPKGANQVEEFLIELRKSNL